MGRIPNRLKHIGIEIAIMEAVLESNKLIVIRKGIVWVESEQNSLLDLKRNWNQ